MSLTSSPGGYINSTSPSSFIPPPLNIGPRNIFGLVEHNIKQNPSYPVFQYADANGNVQQVSWIQISKAFQPAALIVQDYCDVSPDLPKPHIIAILANLDAITYFCLLYGIMLAGFVPFPISLRNSPDGIAHLLSTVNPRALLISKDQNAQALYSASLEISKNKGITKLPTLISAPTFFDLFERSNDGPDLFKAYHNIEGDSLCIIYHSSGTSGYPKPIYLTHDIIFKWGIVMGLREPNVDTKKEIVSMHGLPFYHSMAFCVLLTSITTGVIASVFPPQQNITVPSADSLIEGAIATKSNMIFTIPSFLETWSKNTQRLEVLKSFKSIIYGGGSLSAEIGDTLSREGVSLYPMYGTTETGPVALFLRTDSQSAGWDWIKTAPGAKLAFIPIEDGLYKLIVMENEIKKLAVVNTTVDGVSAYYTADVVVRHPTDPTLWKVLGREDALIVHSSGEKTNPIPIEEHLRQDPRIAAAIMFGRGQLRTGVVILPAESYLFNTADGTKVQNCRNMIWDVIQDANKKAPAHSRIFKEMIIIASYNRPFEYTVKGYPKRHAVLREYDEEIQKLYNETEMGIGLDEYELDSDDLHLTKVKGFIRSVISRTLSRPIEDDDNFFSNGADSLTAIYIRSVILSMLHRRQSSLKVAPNTETDLQPDILFTYPTINSLSLYIYDSYVEPNPDSNRKFTSWLKREDGQDHVNSSAIVKFREGNDGDIPLILIPDITGSSGGFKQFQEKYKSALWSLDITQEPPTFESLKHLALFYYEQIKRERPVGPYRFACFSGSSLILVYLVKLVEQSGDQVLQLAFLDHFPNVYIHGITNPSIFNPNTSTEDHDEYLRNNFKTLNIMASNARKRGIAEVDAGFDWLAQEFGAVMSNRPVSSFLDDTIRIMKMSISISIKFLFGDEFRSEGQWSRDLYISWLKSIKVVPTIYLTTEGICTYLEAPKIQLASGLGAKEAYPSAQVVTIPGDHHDVLLSDIVIQDLQKDFI